MLALFVRGNGPQNFKTIGLGSRSYGLGTEFSKRNGPSNVGPEIGLNFGSSIGNG